MRSSSKSSALTILAGFSQLAEHPSRRADRADDDATPRILGPDAGPPLWPRVMYRGYRVVPTSFLFERRESNTWPATCFPTIDLRLMSHRCSLRARRRRARRAPHWSRRGILMRDVLSLLRTCPWDCTTAIANFERHARAGCRPIRAAHSAVGIERGEPPRFRVRSAVLYAGGLAGLLRPTYADPSTTSRPIRRCIVVPRLDKALHRIPCAFRRRQSSPRGRSRGACRMQRKPGAPWPRRDAHDAI